VTDDFKKVSAEGKCGDANSFYDAGTSGEAKVPCIKGGRYVVVVKSQELTLCEVQVMTPEIPLGSESRPARSCAELKEEDTNVRSGVFWFYAGTDSSTNRYQAVCESTISEGGWMLAMNINPNDAVVD
jgi:hypothetical protein